MRSTLFFGATLAVALMASAQAQMPTAGATKPSASEQNVQPSGSSGEKSQAASAVHELSRINDDLRHAGGMGGHREAAMQHVQAAIDELKQVEVEDSAKKP